MAKEKVIRVAHVVGKWVGGGVESVVMNYYKNIDKDKVQFDFICDSDSTDIPYEEIKKLGGKVFLVPPYQKIFKYIKELTKVLKENDYKIVHSHINTLSVFPLYCAQKAKIPIRIAHSHSTTNKKELGKNFIKQILRPFSKLFATNYFACSEYAGRWLFGNKMYNQGKIYILNNAIDVEKYKYDENVRKIKRKSLGIKNNQIVIGHIGRFVAQKNHTFLIDIFYEIYKQNKNVMLLLIGQGPLVKKIKDKVKKLNLENNVKFLGQRNDVNELYQAMDVFLLPSLYEGLPVVGIEAQASSCLCILSNSMTLETKILDSTLFIDLSEHPKKWAEITIEKLQTYERKSSVMEISKKGFDIQKEAEKLLKIYYYFISELNMKEGK